MIKPMFFLVLAILVVPLVHAGVSGSVSLEIARVAIPENVRVSFEDDFLVCSFEYKNMGVIPVYAWYEDGLRTNVQSVTYAGPVPGSSYICEVLLKSGNSGSIPKNSSPFTFFGQQGILGRGGGSPPASPLTGFVVAPSRIAEGTNFSGSTSLIPIIALLVILNLALIIKIGVRPRNK